MRRGSKSTSGLARRNSFSAQDRVFAAAGRRARRSQGMRSRLCTLALQRVDPYAPVHTVRRGTQTKLFQVQGTSLPGGISVFYGTDLPRKLASGRGRTLAFIYSEVSLSSHAAGRLSVLSVPDLWYDRRPPRKSISLGGVMLSAACGAHLERGAATADSRSK
jgi:hypothetical protein